MVYNRRKRGGDTAAEYFNNTERVAGVKDARHQALMPDVLHFLGIKHIHNLISMSNMKYDAIVGSGIAVGKRYEIPDELIPADGRVEIDAKVSRFISFSNTYPSNYSSMFKTALTLNGRSSPATFQRKRSPKSM